MGVIGRKMQEEMDEAATKALDALSRYKFVMFGYWAGVWVHLNRCSGFHKPNPFTDFVKLAKEYSNEKSQETPPGA